MTAWLTPEQAAPFGTLTTEALALVLPSVRQPLTTPRPQLDGSYLAAGLHFAGMPAALAVLSLGVQSEARLQSLMVAPPCRRLGLATKLMNWIIDEAKQHGWSSLTVSYPLDHPGTAAMQRLTRSELGWQHQPGLRLVHLDRQGGQALVDRLAPLAAHWQRGGRFKLLRWDALAPAEQAQLGARLQAPSWVWPLRDESQGVLIGELDADNSLVLLDHLEPAGWLIAHRVGSELFKVSQWWIVPQLQGRGVALQLLHRAVAGALACRPTYQHAVFGMDPHSKAMNHFSRQQIEPLGCGVQSNERAHLALIKRQTGSP